MLYVPVMTLRELRQPKYRSYEYQATDQIQAPEILLTTNLRPCSDLVAWVGTHSMVEVHSTNDEKDKPNCLQNDASEHDIVSRLCF
jgi:hypothetical protein